MDRHGCQAKRRSKRSASAESLVSRRCTMRSRSSLWSRILILLVALALPASHAFFPSPLFLGTQSRRGVTVSSVGHCLRARAPISLSHLRATAVEPRAEGRGMDRAGRASAGNNGQGDGAARVGDVNQVRSAASSTLPMQREREFFIDNLLVRIHLTIEMIWWTGLAPWEFEFPFPGSLISTFLAMQRPSALHLEPEPRNSEPSTLNPQPSTKTHASNRRRGGRHSRRRG